MEHKIICLLVSIILFLTGCELVHQFDWETEFDKGKVYVSINSGSDLNDGTRNKPVKSINAGIVRAFEKGYDTIYMEAGNYTSSQDALKTGGTNIGVNLNKGNIRIIGGWLDDFSRQGNDEQYSFLVDDFFTVDHILYISGLSNIYLEKIGFAAGIANGGGTDDYGGAVYIENSSNITFERCLFFDNSADAGGGALYISNSSNLSFDTAFFQGNSAGTWGGAIVFTDTTDVTVTRSAFLNNTGADGGAIGVFQSSDLSISNSFFQQNNSTGQGGALITIDSKNIQLQNNSFMKNFAAEGGGAAIINTSNCTIESVFMFNYSTTQAGALYVNGGAAVTITGSLFSGNYSTAPATTGGLSFLNTGSITISDSYIINTSVTGAGSKGLYFFNVQNINLLQNYIDHPNTNNPPERIISFGSNCSDVILMLNVIGGSPAAASYAIYETSNIGLPYRLEGNMFRENTFNQLYYDAGGGPATYNSIDDLNDPGTIGATSAFENVLIP